MVNDILLYVGSVIVLLWGIGHIVPTRNVVKDFGSISRDNKLLITMEWIAEGLTLCFIGLLVLIVTLLHDSQNAVSISIYQISAAMLLVLAALHAMTGARTSILPMKLCPIIISSGAILFILGSIL